MSPLENRGSAFLEVRVTPAAAHLESLGYLARQPILDRRGTVFGYDLHFHGPAQLPHQAMLCDASHGLLDAIAIYGVERFVGGARAFLNCTPDMLVEGSWEGLPSANIVLEISTPTEPVPKLVHACRRLHEAGFQLAIANFNAACNSDDLLGLADFVKVDEAALEGPEWDRVCRKLFGTHATVVAGNIHTHDSYRKARALGIRYFQG